MPKFSFFSKFKRISQEFARQEDGAVAILFGLSVVVLVLVSGIAIDSSRVVHTTSRIQNALDRAAIAAARKLDDETVTVTEVRDTAEKFFQEQLANSLIDDVMFSNFSAMPNFESGTVVVNVNMNLPLYFAALANASTKKKKTMSSTATYKPRKLEVALVVDITGSMSGSRLDALKTSAQTMIDSLHSSHPSSGAVRFSLIPYSSSLNAGPYAGVVTKGTSTDGCVVERKGAKAYMNDPPGPGRFFETSSKAKNGSYFCPSSTIVPLTDLSSPTEVAAFKSHIDNFVARGGTAGHLGLAWGWYSVTPDWAATLIGGHAPRPYDLDNVTKAVVFMTDGMLNTAYNNGGENYVWPDAASTNPTKPGSSSYQALKLCDAMRYPANPEETVKIYTIAFQAPASAKSLLQQCSGTAHYFEAESASELTAAFKSIVDELSKLRISS